MKERLMKLREQVTKGLEQAGNINELEEIRVRYLGKKGEIVSVLKTLSTLGEEERRETGATANSLKAQLTEEISRRKETFKIQEYSNKDDFDITLPGIRPSAGTYHPITIVQREVEEIFKSMGFYIGDTVEVETPYYNFEALNTPEHHPARDMQDTYWLDNGMVLRTQTSAGQVRMMEEMKPPIKVIIPGRCFRNEDIDPSHENTFFQLEGVVIDKGVSVANLIYTMETLLTLIFHHQVTVRLRPGYFPFVEPGFELDMQCGICGGKGCPTCKYSGWLELLPCGMVHPNVLRAGGVDTEVYTGFAFGLGLTRLAMMKYAIPDIRVFNSGDLKALGQFR